MIKMDEILYDLNGGVATITFNRPAQLNAMSSGGMKQLFEALRRFDADDQAHVGILTGAGERAFCVGRDLKEKMGAPFELNTVPLIGSTIEISKPVIAAVNGSAFGGGFLFAQMCDLCIAADHATFSIPEAKLGRGAAWAAPLINQFAPRVLMEMLLVGAPLTAQRMEAVGFVNAVVPLPELAATARKMALQIAANAPLAVKACRKMVRDAASLEYPTYTEAQAKALFKHVYDSGDALEGPLAFREKRLPVWQGR